jgi:hypothetical protein
MLFEVDLNGHLAALLIRDKLDSVHAFDVPHVVASRTLLLIGDVRRETCRELASGLP